MFEKEINEICDYLSAKHALFYIQNSDYFSVKEIIKEISLKTKCKTLYYTNADGVNLNSDFGAEYQEDISGFLRYIKLSDESYKEGCVVVLKDISTSLNDPAVISNIKEIAEKSISDKDFTVIIFIVESSTCRFPVELESLITVIDIKPLDEKNIKEVIEEFKKNNDDLDFQFSLEDDNGKRFINSFKGLQKFQIEQILNTAKTKSKKRKDNNKIKVDDTKIILEEKKQLIKKSGILEIIDTNLNKDNIGGLENLKEWLEKKAIIYKDITLASDHHVTIPKGILIVGMPGCGKSLTAKATASMFEIPLVRLDIGSLLGKYVGESEGNMKKALMLSEAFAPCVLWIDELEKAFAGIKSGGEGNEIVTRLFGQFLTWMQEKNSAVFIVATANSISSLPPEFLRKGRFDELFKVELPTEEELKQIIKIKLKEKNIDLSEDELKKLASLSYKKSPDSKFKGGCNGGDIEAMVNQAVEDRFIYWQTTKNSEDEEVRFDDLKKTFEDTDMKSVAQTLQKKIEELRNELEKYPFRSASKA